MRAQIKLGCLFGVEIGLHYSWLIIALLITFSLTQRFYTTNPDWGAGVIWGSAIVTGLLSSRRLFCMNYRTPFSKARGLPVRSIPLFALGDLAQIEKDAEDAKTEFWMGFVGPLTSFVLGLCCLGLAWVAGWRAEMVHDTPAIAILTWLGFINIALAVFNLIPGFPLDGGRVLRALIWWITGSANRATRIAALTGPIDRSRVHPARHLPFLRRRRYRRPMVSFSRRASN